MAEKNGRHPENRLGSRLKLGLLIILATFLAWTILMPNGRARENFRRTSCQSNLKQIMRSVSQYMQDYDGKYPLAEVASPDLGWSYNIMPYLHATVVLQCPSDKNAPKTNSSIPTLTHSNYWFNARLSGVVEKRIVIQSKTITFGDGFDTVSSSYHLFRIPNQWRSDEKSPLYRHLDGANFAFADGHIKWFSALNWKNELDMKNGPTFRLNPKK